MTATAVDQGDAVRGFATGTVAELGRPSTGLGLLEDPDAGHCSGAQR